ncbi:amino acid adenylation domain-containing protein [Xenorhabdus bovienii]|uniref:non-ribosomal peptide synthetase n=1 Tax=Xenorhabdus bovienii TaxID=40576 RepID=UPI00237C5441|nr:non-ribosomal peptide synthetase [Xenorhabdus bovienii]MDE1487946.1 amino acid adenylation domain-containing protein [Xenorhabdus bovienii]MDE9478856.1 amino acid adenylation domain-containing protein [Xenorhabdus bovienii]MDE9531664.1 amino acid adenylation domain-containing protein [Xenorhabdus bovienii]
MSKGYESIQSMPLTAAQSGIWIGQALEPTSAKYNTAEYLEFKGYFCPKSFEAASQYVLQNVATLNVSFKFENHSLVHGILESKDIESNRISYIDLSDSTSKKNDMLTYMQEQTYLKLEIEIGKNYRHSLIKLGDEHYVWYLCIHHIASDGYSFSLIVNAVLDQYKKIRSQGKKISLPFDDYTYLEIEDKKYRQSEFFSRDAKYWMEFLLNTKPPRSFSTCSIKSIDEKISKSTVISAHDFNRIKTISNQYKINWDTFFISIISVLLYKYSGIEETVFALPVANRLGSKVANIPCNHMNMVPIKIQIEPLSTLLDLNTALINQIKIGRKHWRYRYEDLQSDLKRILDRDKLFGPIINVMYFDKNIELDGCQVKPYTLNTGPVDDISFIFIKQRDESVVFTLDANSKMYTEADIEKIKTGFIDYIQEIEMHITERIVNNSCTVENLLYWQKALDGYEILNLPINNLRTTQFDYNRLNISLELSDNISNRLRDLALSEGTNLFSVLLSAWYVMLLKLTGQTDILVGTKKNTQYYTKSNLLIGELANSLLLRVQLSQNHSLRELVNQVHQIVIGAEAHQDLPFEYLVEIAGGSQDTLIHSLLQVMFTVEHFDQQSQPYATKFLDENLPSSTKLYLNLFEGTNTIAGRLNFSESLFNIETIERIVSMYQLVLKQFAETPCTLIQNVFVLSAKERETLLHAWNRTDAEYPHDSTLHELFEAQADTTPDNIALVFEGEELTYRELNERANQLAHVIRQNYQQQCGQSMPADTLVALYLERSLEMVISILAVLKAGGAYVPISPEYPPERTGFILNDTKAPLLVTQQQYLAVLEDLVGDELGAPLLMAADGDQVTEGLPIENPESVSGPGDLAYVIYTSGTTGQPKGVPLEHKSVISRIHWMQSEYPLSVEDRVLQKTPYTFDVSVLELIWANWIGATTVIAAPSIHKQPESLHKLIIESGITILHFVPSMLDAFCKSLTESKNSLSKNIRFVFCCGEALTQSHVRTFNATNSGLSDLINLYGPTEAAIQATFFDTANNFIGNVPIGSAISNTRLYVLDGNQQLVPFGTAGELYIGGVGVARGYLNRPELTAERFINNPFATEGDRAKGYTRLYKTGDLVRWLPDGNLEYLGRNDFQVKIRGFRIELGEVESALAAHEQVAQAVVVDREKEGSKYLAAYMVPEQESSIDIEELIAHLLSSLPEYMLPSTFTQIESVPLTLNGKLDRCALPIPEWINAGTYVAPHNELENQLCGIWQEVLGLERVGIHDNFFRVGGDSIVSIQLVSKLRQAGFPLQMKSIFDAPTVMQLADLLSQTTIGQNTLIEQGALSGEFDLLPIQQWFFNLSLASPHHFNQSFTIQLPAGIPPSNIERAIIILSERHDMLRASFLPADSGYRQYYHAKPVGWVSPIEHCDVSKLDESGLHAVLTGWQSHFDYHRGPLWQAGHLTGYSDGRSRLFFAFHHLIIDVVSWRIIVEDMRVLLTGQTLRPKTSSYRQWVAMTNDYVREQYKELVYWQKVMEGGLVFSEPGAIIHQVVSLSAELTDRLLHEAIFGYHTEINDLLLSALALALRETFGRSVNHITLEGHGRELINAAVDITETVGWFTIKYPVRLEAHNELSENIIYTKEMLRAIPNKGIGYGAFYQAGVLEGELPLISFNYLSQQGGKVGQSSYQDWELMEENNGVMMSPDNTTHLLLDINGSIQGGVLQFGVISRLSQTQTECFKKAFTDALAAVIRAAVEQAKSGGIKTPSDYGVSSLPIKQINRLQQTHQVEEIYPANSLQQGMVYHHLTQPQDDAYRIQMLFDYQDGLDVAVYQKAWFLASLRFPILRTAFDWEGEVLQVVTSGASIGPANFIFKDISDIPEEKRDAAVAAIQQQDRAIPFDLSRPGLIRFTIIRQSGLLVTVLKSVHHCITDGWSGPILLQAVHEYYNVLMRGESPVVEIDRAFLDTQQYHLKHKSASEAYWSVEKGKYLGTNDLSYMLSFPVELSLVKVVDRPSRKGLTIRGEIYHQLKTMCKEQGVTLNVVTQFAWHKLLQCYTGDEQTIVGTTVSGRDVPIEGITSSVGVYINTLPLKVEWESKGTIASVLQLIQKGIAAINTYSAMSLANLQTNGQRLFHSLFVFENYPQIGRSGAGGGIEDSLSFRYTVGKANYPLSIMAYEKDDSLVVNLGYGKDWLDDTQAQRLLSQFERILVSAAADPYQTHQSIAIMSDKERGILLHTWNRTNVAYPDGKTLHELFEVQADTTPDNIALMFEGEELTYRKLNERANQLAHAIRQNYQQQCGQLMPADTLVALYLERSLEMVISILAVLKAGGAYVPISPEYPPERTGFILNDTKAPLLVTQQQYLAVLEDLVGEELGAPLLMAADEEQVTEGLPLENPEPVSGPRNLAYVIYTSGTTGQPKGVMIEHRSINNLIKGLINHYPVLPSDVTLLIPNYIFDAFIEEVFVTLLVGAQLVILSSEDILLHNKVQNVINEYSVNRLGATPSWLLAIRDHIEWPKIKIIAGGEVLPPSLHQGNWNIINTYGPTESTITSNIFKLDRWTESNSSIPIGSPLPNYKSYVLNAEAQLLPIGVPGELYIGGAGLARGYLNRSELTAERFIDNPFATEEDRAKGYTRLYKTGDLVRWLPDGNLEYLGRNDFQVKIRGFRIELAEIENTLMKHADIGKAVVVTQKYNGQHCLVAYLVMNNKKINIEAINAFISHLLPDYMLPEWYIQLETLPLTINGKLDRRALPACQFNDRVTYSAPRNSTEENLCEIWSEVLKRERTGIDDDFFKVGGSSLNVFILRSKIWQKIALDIPVKAFYSQRTIRKMMDNVITERFLCLEDEVAAMKEISFSTAMISVSDPSRRHIFLTGATGFIGKYILHELLKDKNVNLTCLIRADNKNDGFFRLKSTLENATLWCEDYIGRIAIVNGDLGQENMGMTPKEYSSLSETIDTIFHCAVHMNHLATYDMMKKINVDGTNQLLHFATQTRVKVFNMLSTVGVFNNHAQDTVEEDTPLNIQKHNSQNGYCSSKWVAEALVLRARVKGLTTNIFRLGLISGSRENYQNDKNQWFGQLLRTCRLTGLAFKGEDIDVSTVPVDFVAKAVIYLSTHPNGHNGNYHIVANTPYTLEKIIEQYNSLCDSKILLVPFSTFIENLKGLRENKKEIPIPYFIKEYLDHSNIELDEIHFKSKSAKIKCEKTTKILTQGGIVEKEISADMIVNYIENELN